MLENKFVVLENEVVETSVVEPNLIDNQWRKIQGTVNNTVKEVCGKKQKMKKNPWFSDECQTLVNKRK